MLITRLLMLRRSQEITVLGVTKKEQGLSTMINTRLILQPFEKIHTSPVAARIQRNRFSRVLNLPVLQHRAESVPHFALCTSRGHPNTRTTQHFHEKKHVHLFALSVLHISIYIYH
eukprot:GHVL01000636.1.p1 GENE.GHVL01000636.1~~GHVL01000636.1.p1  ORF type:complete len:116 (-),score=4.71 GHVL01000636.1:542-889(-)